MDNHFLNSSILLMSCLGSKLLDEFSGLMQVIRLVARLKFLRCCNHWILLVRIIRIRLPCIMTHLNVSHVLTGKVCHCWSVEVHIYLWNFHRNWLKYLRDQYDNMIDSNVALILYYLLGGKTEYNSI